MRSRLLQFFSTTLALRLTRNANRKSLLIRRVMRRSLSLKRLRLRVALAPLPRTSPRLTPMLRVCIQRRLATTQRLIPLRYADLCTRRMVTLCLLLGAAGGRGFYMENMAARCHSTSSQSFCWSCVVACPHVSASILVSWLAWVYLSLEAVWGQRSLPARGGSVTYYRCLLLLCPRRTCHRPTL